MQGQNTQPTSFVVVLGGVIFIVIAIGSKVRGFEPGRERWILRAINNP
jgi:hypothetical protein